MDNTGLPAEINWFGYGGGLVDIGEEQQIDFSYPLLNWYGDHYNPMEAAVSNLIEPPTPLQSLDPDSFLLTQDQNLFLHDEFYSMFDDEKVGNCEGKGDGTEVKIDHGEVKRDEEMKEKKLERFRELERVMTFEDVSPYFYMPITEAAKKLNVGLTLLKKKCRELGIPRWPHRKMKSLQTLIQNVQELGRREGDQQGETQIRSAVEILEKERKLMEKEPGLQLEEKTKRLRQACFKANYKKRRLMGF